MLRYKGSDANEGVETMRATLPNIMKGIAAVLHELHGLPIGVQYTALAVVVIIVIASLIAGCWMVSHFHV